MASLQSLRELISSRLSSAAQDISDRFEENVVHYEEDQRKLQELTRKPQSRQYSVVLPQHDSGTQERSSRVKQENPEPPQIKEELCSLQDEEQETGAFMEPPVYEENRAAGLKSHQILTHGTDDEDEEGGQHEESVSA